MRHSSRYSAKFSQDLKGKISMILFSAKEALTIPEIIAQLGMTDLTSAKVAVEIKKIAETIPLVKAKNRKGLMCYKLRAYHEMDGYDGAVHAYFPDKGIFDADLPDKDPYFFPGRAQVETRNKTMVVTGYNHPNGWIAPRYRALYEAE